MKALREKWSETAKLPPGVEPATPDYKAVTFSNPPRSTGN